MRLISFLVTKCTWKDQNIKEKLLLKPRWNSNLKHDIDFIPIITKIRLLDHLCKRYDIFQIPIDWFYVDFVFFPSSEKETCWYHTILSSLYQSIIIWRFQVSLKLCNHIVTIRTAMNIEYFPTIIHAIELLIYQQW